MVEIHGEVCLVAYEKFLSLFHQGAAGARRRDPVVYSS